MAVFAGVIMRQDRESQKGLWDERAEIFGPAQAGNCF
jgi:hypothetical protein